MAANNSLKATLPSLWSTKVRWELWCLEQLPPHDYCNKLELTIQTTDSQVASTRR